MDATSIITQVSRDDEQLNAYAGEKGESTYPSYKNLVSLEIHIQVKSAIFCFGFRLLH